MATTNLSQIIGTVFIGAQGHQGAQGAVGAQGAQGATGPSTSINATEESTTNASHYPVFLPSVGTAQTAEASSTKLYFNPSTGTLNATIFNSLSDIKSKQNIAPEMIPKLVHFSTQKGQCLSH